MPNDHDRDAADDHADLLGTTWEDLPVSVQAAAVTLAGKVLSAIPLDQVPAYVAPLVRLKPGRRSVRGSAPLARALAHDEVFRAMVAQRVSLLDLSTDDDGALAAARSFLLRLPDLASRVEDARRADEAELWAARARELTGVVEDLTARLAQVEGGGDSAGSQPPPSAGTASLPRRGGARPGQDPSDLVTTVDRLRQRLRDQGARHRAERLEWERSVAELERERDELRVAALRDAAAAKEWQARAELESRRADAVEAAVDQSRQDNLQQRADGDRRIDLLLEAIEQAAAGVRREWRRTPGGDDPADVVSRRWEGPSVIGHRGADASTLVAWLALPQAHLIVDGYNVTKSGFGHLSLADQRDRLVRALGGLAARTGCEVTAVFDGAAVVARAASTSSVRVLFSPPQVTADEVVRQLAGAEPAGRVVVVASSDREVRDGARKRGARTVSSAVLLEVLR